MPIFVTDPNDLTQRPPNAVLISPMPDGTWRVYVEGDPDIPAFVEEIGQGPQEPIEGAPE